MAEREQQQGQGEGRGDTYLTTPDSDKQPTQTPGTDPGKTIPGENSEKPKAERMEYDKQAKEKYDQLLEELQVWCRMEAEKHSIEASWFQNKCLYLEAAAAVLSCISIAVVAGFLFEWVASAAGDNNDALNAKWSRIGILGFAGVVLAGVLQFVGKGSASLVPTFQKRADQHRKLTLGWQYLKRDVKSTRIELRNPDADTAQLRCMYRQHVKESQQLSQTTLVSKKTSDQLSSLCDIKSIEEWERQFLCDWPADKMQSRKRRH